MINNRGRIAGRTYTAYRLMMKVLMERGSFNLASRNYPDDFLKYLSTAGISASVSEVQNGIYLVKREEGGKLVSCEVGKFEREEGGKLEREEVGKLESWEVKKRGNREWDVEKRGNREWENGAWNFAEEWGKWIDEECD
jgi:hypothetical protein